MLLSKETQKLEVILAAAKTTVDCDFSVTYVDKKRDAQWSGQLFYGKSNGVAAVVATPAPDQITSRDIERFFFHNTDSAAVTVTVRYNDGGVITNIKTSTLNSKQTLSFGVNFGWMVN